jgi:DNA-binding transcriptional LysR family regulator
MELYQLRGFLMVAKLGSFTRAAEALFITQPALSLQVKALEQSLGESLFERQGRTLLLTPAGRILQRQAERILGLLAQAEQEIGDLQGIVRGRLAIGTNDSYCLYLLPGVVERYRGRFPGVELYLTNCSSTQVATLVAEGEVDFGLVTLPVANARVESKPLFWREDVLVCAPDHPLCSQTTVALQLVVAHPLLLLDRGSSRALLDTMFREMHLTPEIVIELGSVEVIKRYVEIDLGLSIIPKFTAERELAENRLHAIHLDWLPPRAVGIVQRRTGYLSPAALKFVELLDNYATEHWSASSAGPVRLIDA